MGTIVYEVTVVASDGVNDGYTLEVTVKVTNDGGAWGNRGDACAAAGRSWADR